MIYVASSWRNLEFNNVVEALSSRGYRVYDFKHTSGGGFRWSEVDAKWEQWGHQEYFNALVSDRAQEALRNDCGALLLARAVILVMPCGRSAHLEAGWALGASKPLCIYMPTMAEPELMYGMADCITPSLERVIK